MRQLVSFLPFIAILGLMWLLLVRPAQRRQAQAVNLQKSVEIGDEVVLTSGIFGTIAESTEDHLGIEVADGVTIRVLRGAIASKVNRYDDVDSSAEAGPRDATDTTTDGASAVDGED